MRVYVARCDLGRWCGRLVPGDVADEATAAKLQEFAEVLRVFVQHRGLALLDLSDHCQCVLEVFDGLSEVGHRLMNLAAALELHEAVFEQRDAFFVGA